MESQILLAIHGHATAWLDAVFLFSHELGTIWVCTAVVLLAVVWHAWRREPYEVLLWVALGISTYLLQKGIKVAVGRIRPDLWLGPIKLSSPAFPSGHALAAATFYPLLARIAARRWPSRAAWLWGAGVLVALFVGFGRLYLGVHWPSDVLAGWAIGAAQTVAGVILIDKLRRERSEVESSSSP